MSDIYMHGYRFRIYPTEKQKELINRLIDLYRFAYNWGIARQKEQYRKRVNGETKYGILSYYDFCREFTIFRNLPENAWMKELPSSTAKLALRDVAKSFKDFFSRKFGYPKFKSKKRSPKMFKTRNDRFYIDGDGVRIEGLYYELGKSDQTETINLHHDFGYRKSDKTKYIQPSISIDNLGEYWVSFSIEEPVIHLNKPKTEAIGIDVGIRQTMVLSTGEVFIRPKNKIKRLDKRLRHAWHHMTRDIKRRRQEAIRTKTKYEDIPVSNRAKKRENKVKKLHKKITNVKRDFYHNTIKSIVTRNPEAIVIETLHSRDIERQHKGRPYISHEIHHADFYTMHKIIEDKCNTYGIHLVKATDEYPSSQICSNCGYQQDIGRKTLYRCPICGMELDRDINAALNLRNLVYVA